MLILSYKMNLDASAHFLCSETILFLNIWDYLAFEWFSRSIWAWCLCGVMPWSLLYFLHGSWWELFNFYCTSWDKWYFSKKLFILPTFPNIFVCRYKNNVSCWYFVYLCFLPFFLIKLDIVLPPHFLYLQRVKILNY